MYRPFLPSTETGQGSNTRILSIVLSVRLTKSCYSRHHNGMVPGSLQKSLALCPLHSLLAIDTLVKPLRLWHSRYHRKNISVIRMSIYRTFFDTCRYLLHTRAEFCWAGISEGHRNISKMREISRKKFKTIFFDFETEKISKGQMEF